MLEEKKALTAVSGSESLLTNINVTIFLIFLVFCCKQLKCRFCFGIIYQMRDGSYFHRLWIS